VIDSREFHHFYMFDQKLTGT